jgi:hypothetical protein
MKRVAVFVSSKNSPGMNDAQGAFIPEAQRFVRLHGIPNELVFPIPVVDIPFAKRRPRVAEHLKTAGQLDGMAFFCHGWQDGMQFGFTRATVPILVDSLVTPAPLFHVAIYGCLTAENDVVDGNVLTVGPGTDGGFADILRDELCRKNFSGWVDAHKTAGRAAANPFVVRFRTEDVEDRKIGGVGGDWIVCPGSSVWKRWKAALAAEKNGTRFLFPFMTSSEVKLSLEA